MAEEITTKKKYYAEFIGGKGHKKEGTRAKHTFKEGQKYLLEGGELGLGRQTLKFVGIPGDWNATMFVTDAGASEIMKQRYVPINQY